MASDIFRLGSSSRVGTGQFDNLLGTQFRPQQDIQQPQGNYYLSDQMGSNQGGGGGYANNNEQDQNNAEGMFSNKLFPGQLNQLPDFQGNPNHTFNLGFYSGNNNNNNNSTTDTNTNNTAMNSNSTGSGDHSSSVFSPGGSLFGGHQISSGGSFSSIYNSGPTIQPSSSTPHMSATVLLQKAAQMGSTTSTTNASATALLKGFDSKSSQPLQQQPAPAAIGVGFGGINGDQNDQNNIHEMFIRDFSRDNLMNSSLFGVPIEHHAPHIGQQQKQGDNTTNSSFNPNPNTNTNTKPGQNCLGIGSSDPLTRDFLGVGQIVRSMSGGGGFTASQNAGINMVNLDSNADQTNNNNNLSNNNSAPTSGNSYQ